jgi:hypothetical protein
MCVGVPERRRAGASAGAQAYPRARAGACVYVCTGARVCAYVCARVHGLILPTLLYINPLTERVPVYV